MNDPKNIYDILQTVDDEFQYREQFPEPYKENTVSTKTNNTSPSSIASKVKDLNKKVKVLMDSIRSIDHILSEVIECSRHASGEMLKEMKGKYTYSSDIIKENAKRLNSLSRELSSVLEEYRKINRKMLFITDDIGHILDRYYEIY